MERLCATKGPRERRSPGPGEAVTLLGASGGAGRRSRSGVIVVACGHPAQDAALPIGRAPAGRARGQLGRLTDRGEVACDAGWVAEDGDEPHAPLADGAGERVQAESTGEQLRPGAVSAPRHRTSGGRQTGRFSSSKDEEDELKQVSTVSTVAGRKATRGLSSGTPLPREVHVNWPGKLDQVRARTAPSSRSGSLMTVVPGETSIGGNAPPARTRAPPRLGEPWSCPSPRRGSRGSPCSAASSTSSSTRREATSLGSPRPRAS